jgi:hypothetical protein
MFSFSFDFSSVFTMASQIISGLFPIYIVPLGFSLAFGILGYIVAAFSKIVRH